jgi:hypothetical protein
MHVRHRWVIEKGEVSSCLYEWNSIVDAPEEVNEFHLKLW